MRPYRHFLVLLLLVALFYGAYHAITQFGSVRSTILPLASIPTSTPSPTMVATAASTPSPSPTATVAPTAIVVPHGSIVLEDGTIATPTPQPRFVREEALIEQYGTLSFDSPDEMPEDLWYYFTTTVEEVSTFFAVRPEDLIALLRAQNGGQLRIYREPDTVRGVAQLPPRIWSGWAAPDHARYVTDQRSIERYGGVGFDWNARRVWRAWMDGEMFGTSPFGLEANPDSFPNAVAALARYLVQNGLTRDIAERDPETFEQHWADALEVLNHQAQPKAMLALPAMEDVPVSAEEMASLRRAFGDLMDRHFGVALSEQDLIAMVDHSTVAIEVGS
ncbi:MAG: hypothetical protein M3220_00300, partial [Chloroflexota bacterium]|nr:hypothetical protein [Chloroflexota bacterium]